MPEPLNEKLQEELQESSQSVNNTAEIIAKDKLDEQYVVQFVKDRFDKSKKQRQFLDLIWQQAYAYYNGNQDVAIDDIGQGLVPRNQDALYSRTEPYNMIHPIVNTKISLLNKYKYVPRAIAADGTDESRAKAQECTKLLKYISKAINFPEKLMESFLYTEVFGCAIFKTYWDTQGGWTIKTVKEKKPENEGHDENAKIELEAPKTWERQIKTGLVQTEVISPWEIYPASLQFPLREQEYIIHSVLLTPQEVYDRYGVWLNGSRNATLRMLATSTMLQSQFAGPTETGLIEIEDTVRIYEMWEAPSPSFPEGRLVTVAENTLLHYSSLPYTYEDGMPMLPFVVQKALPSDNFFGDSIIRQLVPLQDSLNDCSNEIMDYIDRIAVGVFTAVKGSIDNPQKYLNEGLPKGSIIEYYQGFNPPQMLNPASLPSDVFNMKATIIADMQRLSGLNELTMTASSSPYATGSVLQELARAADVRMSAQHERVRIAVANIGKQWLSLCKDFMIGAIFYDIINDDAMDSGQVTPDDIDCTEVVIEDEPELTLVARQQNLGALIQYGAFQPGAMTATALEMIFDLYDLGTSEKVEQYIQEVREQEKQAQQAQSQAMQQLQKGEQ